MKASFMKIYFFVFNFTSLRENMRINSRHPWQCCLTEDNYLACIRSYVVGQSGVTTSSGETGDQHGTNTITTTIIPVSLHTVVIS